MALRVGIFGGGVVGGGVYELVQKCLDSGRLKALGSSIEIVKICVKSIDKPRDFQVRDGCKFVTSYDEILMDSSINCVVELMGGITK
jgi:homoserine dehydrogenase